MFKGIKEGISKGIGMFIVFGTAVFAINVSGTIKTWSSGEILTANDLNTTVQSLKTAVESATQLVEIGTTRAIGAWNETIFYGRLTSDFVSRIPIFTTMTRSGTVKNAKIVIHDIMYATCTITLVKNGSDTSISLTATNGLSSGTFTDPDTVEFISGDTLGWKNSCTTNQGSPVILSFEF
jgi:hypothetical protein